MIIFFICASMKPHIQQQIVANLLTIYLLVYPLNKLINHFGLVTNVMSLNDVDNVKLVTIISF